MFLLSMKKMTACRGTLKASPHESGVVPGRLCLYRVVDYGEEGDSIHFFLIAVKNDPEGPARAQDWRAPVEFVVESNAPERV